MLCTTSHYNSMATNRANEKKQLKRKVKDYEKEQKRKQNRIEKYKKRKTELLKHDEEMTDASILPASEWLNRLPVSQLKALVKRFDPNPPDLRFTTKDRLCDKLASLEYITLEGMRYYYTAKYGNVSVSKHEAREHEASLVDLWYRQTYEWLRVGESFNMSVDANYVGDKPVTKRFIVAKKVQSEQTNDQGGTIYGYRLSCDEFTEYSLKRSYIEHFPIPISEGHDFICKFKPRHTELFIFKFNCNKWILTNGYKGGVESSTSYMPWWSEGNYSISMNEFAYMHIMRMPARFSLNPASGCPEISMQMNVIVRSSQPTAIRQECNYVFHLGCNEFNNHHKLRSYNCLDGSVVNLATSAIESSLNCKHFRLTTRNGIVRFTTDQTTDVLTGRSCKYELDLHDLYRVDNRAIMHTLVGLSKSDGNSLNTTFKSNPLFDKNTLDMMIDYVKSDDWSTMPLTDYRKGDGWITKPVAK